MKWRVILEHDPVTNAWAAWCPELPGCASAGETEDEVLAAIREAIALYVRPDPIDIPPHALLREVTVYPSD